MKGLLYKGYTASLEVLPEEKIVLGRLDGIPDTITFQVESLDQIEKMFKETVDAFLAGYETMGRIPPKPCSGNVQFRVAPGLHAAALHVAKEYGSFNKFGEHLLRKAVADQFPDLAAA
ncbi:MAG: toxin-antitoxin system HicB family antitoxin [Planctomycetes bacterium]|nr:toxin-antitoxin system HicB family antitoxin [Planctomycetota bacterium]